jgi:predicted transcriptional regulator
MNDSDISTRDICAILNRLEREFGSHAKIAKMLDIAQAHIHNCVTGKRGPSKKLIGSLQKNGYLPAPKKRIRSQITWESEEQKRAILNHVEREGCSSLSILMRQVADTLINIDRYAVRDFPAIHYHDKHKQYPIDTGEDL